MPLAPSPAITPCDRTPERRCPGSRTAGVERFGMLTGRAMLGHGVATRCLLLRLSPITLKGSTLAGSAGTFRCALRYTDFDKASGGLPVTSPCPSALRAPRSSQGELITCGNARKLSSQDRPQASLRSDAARGGAQVWTRRNWRAEAMGVRLRSAIAANSQIPREYATHPRLSLYRSRRRMRR